MYRYAVDRHTVLSPERPLGGYMPGLAVSLAARFGWAPGEKFLTDLFNLMADDTSIFPPDIGRLGRKMRLDRLLEQPVQVDDLVLRLVADERTRMYQKTRRVVLERGVLHSIATRDLPEPQQVATYVDPSVARAPAADADPALIRRIEALEQTFGEFRTYSLGRISAVESVLIESGIPDDARTEFDGLGSAAASRIGELTKRVDEMKSTLFDTCRLLNGARMDLRMVERHLNLATEKDDE